MTLTASPTTHPEPDRTPELDTFPFDTFPFGTAVTIAPGAHDISGAALGEDERLGVVMGVTEDPHAGEVWYRIATHGGTHVVIAADHVATGVPAARAVASFAVEIFGEYGWEQVPAGRGCPTAGAALIEPTQDALDAFVVVAAARARTLYRRVRVSIALVDGSLTAYHEEPPLRGHVDPRNPTLPAVIVTAGGRNLPCTFGSLRHRRRLTEALLADPFVVAVSWEKPPR